MTQRALILVVVVVVATALHLARGVLVPLALAVLLSFLLAPIVTRLQHIGLPRVAAVMAAVSLALLLVVALVALVAGQVGDLTEKLPEYTASIREKAHGVREFVASKLGKATATVEEVVAPTTAQAEDHPKVQVIPARSPVQAIRELLGPLLAPLGTAGLVIVLVIFILLQREDLRDRVIRLIGDQQINITTQAIDDAAKRVSRYLVSQSIINGLQGLVVGVGLFLLGVPNAALWGLLSALLRFIPYLGPWMAALMPITLSLGYFDNWTRPLIIIAFFVVVELISNNVAEPLIYGTRTGLSPLAVIVSAIFWTFLWGGIGLILATPLTVCLVVIGKYVPRAQFLSILLGDEPPLLPSTRFYQRLLARDQAEAEQILEEHLKTGDLATVYDDVVLPALSFVEHDRHRGLLDATREQFIETSVREILKTAAAKPAAKANPAEPVNGNDASTPRPISVGVCLPARDEADELAGLMLAQVVQEYGIRLITVPVGALASEMVDLVELEKAEFVLISALPPATVAHARYLCKRFMARYSELPLLVGLWTSRVDPKTLEQRLACDGSVRIVRTLREARDAVRQTANLVSSNSNGREEPALHVQHT